MRLRGRRGRPGRVGKDRGVAAHGGGVAARVRLLERRRGRHRLPRVRRVSRVGGGLVPRVPAGEDAPAGVRLRGEGSRCVNRLCLLKLLSR